MSPPVTATPTPQAPTYDQLILKDYYDSVDALKADLAAKSPYGYNVYLKGERLNIGAGPDDVYSVDNAGRVYRYGMAPPAPPVSVDPPPASGGNTLWRSFRFVGEHLTKDQLNFNAIADSDIDDAMVYAVKRPGVKQHEDQWITASSLLMHQLREDMDSRGFLAKGFSGAFPGIYTNDSAGPSVKAALGFVVDYVAPQDEWYDTGNGFKLTKPNGQVVEYVFKWPILVTTVPYYVTDEDLRAKGWADNTIRKLRDYQAWLKTRNA